MGLTTQQIADLTGGTLSGPGDVHITAMQYIDRAQAGELVMIGSDQYAARWPGSGASAALAARSLNLQPDDGRAIIHVDDVDLASAAVLQQLIPPPPQPAAGVDPQASVHDTATIGTNTRIGPGCVVGPRVVIGDDVTLQANVTVLDDSAVGDGCVLWPGVVLRERTRMGKRCILHPNVSIGGDGFGFRPAADGKSIVKIPQVGYVEIGDDVEIGSGTCIDRGKFGPTTIGHGTKLDNLVQIAHNCRIGQRVLIAAQSEIGGSVTIGDDSVLGGGAAIADHIHIGSKVRLAGHAGAIHDAPDGVHWAGTPARSHVDTMKQWAALRALPQMYRDWKKSRRDKAR